MSQNSQNLSLEKIAEFMQQTDAALREADANLCAAAEEKSAAKELVEPTLQALVDAGLLPSEKKAAVRRALSTHAGTMELLQQASAHFGELWAQKRAQAAIADQGHAVPSTGSSQNGRSKSSSEVSEADLAVARRFNMI